MYSRKEIWRISLPILVSLFVQNLINITDTAFMGRVGQVELGASALAGVLYLAFYMVTFGLAPEHKFSWLVETVKPNMGLWALSWGKVFSFWKYFQ